MENPFYNDIYEILQTKGCEGLPVGIIAKQVYNRHAGLFNTELTYEKVYQNVRFFLWAQSSKPSSPFMGAAQRGWYALKPNVCRQMRIDFTEIPSEEATEVPEKALHLRISETKKTPPHHNPDGTAEIGKKFCAKRKINLSRLKNRLAQNKKPFSRRCRTHLIL